MGAELKNGLTKFAIIAIVLAFMFMALIWMCLQKDLSSIHWEIESETITSDLTINFESSEE